MIKSRWLAAVVLPAFWLFAFLVFLQHASPAASSSPHLTSANYLDVVINEVAWGGTKASATDEWIELYDNTDAAVDLAGWTLASVTDGSPNITLSGTIQARSYFLLERTDDNTVSDIPADQIYRGDLNNAGEVLQLKQGASLIDSANVSSTAWITGTASPSDGSMERINPLLPDTNTNWAANDGIIRNGLDANGNPITGTPKQPNSATPAELSVRESVTNVALVDRPITYTLRIVNLGGKKATGVLITDTWSVSMTVITQTSSFPFTFTDRVLAWQVGTLSSYSGTLSFDIVVTTPPGFAGEITNTASITSDVTDYRPDNNVHTSTLLVRLPIVDLAIGKTGPAYVAAGGEFTYTITFSNTGQADAANVLITDTLPVSATWVRGTTAYSLSQPASGTLVWQADSVPVNRPPVTLAVVVTTTPDTIGWLTNVVTLTTTTVEADMTNNSASAATFVTLPVSSAAPPHVLISAVHDNGYDGVNDEAMQLTNVGTQTVSLLGWRLTEGSSSGVTCPAFSLAPGQRVWVANRADAFYAMFGEWPTFAKAPTASVLALAGTWPGLANAHGDVKLFDNLGALRDRMLYGTATTPPGGGWESTAVQPYTPTTAFAGAGQILYRKLDEATGLPHDTDTSADWAQDRADPGSGRRVRYPGWDLETFYRTAQVTQTALLTIGVAPDNAFQVISQVIASAQQTLTVEVYSFENAALAELLAARAQAGVTVTILLEGSPAGGLTDQEKWACQQVEAASGACWFMHNDAANQVHARYSNQHAKVIVADDRLIAIGSENLSPCSFPDDDKSDGTAGQRGVVLVTDASGVVEQARRIWSVDFDPAHHRDLIRWSSGDPVYGQPPIGFVPITVTGGTTYTVRFSQPLVLSGTFPFEVIQSPENSLRQSDGLLGLISRAGAGDEIAVEQLEEPPHWGASSGTPQSDPNVVLEALIAAASRGARVRLLLDAYFDSGDNAATVAYVESLRALSNTLRVNLQAHTGNPTALGIHNKMLVASIGGQGYVHVGSLNHGELALKGNREVALQLQSDAAYAYLRRMFDLDWYRVYLPVVVHNYTPPPPPADYVLISEVYYSATVAEQWVEIYNPTLKTIDLSNYKIGDAATSTDYEGMYRFPTGAWIGPYGVYVIAFDASQVPQANFQICSTCPSSVPVLPKYPAWGAGDWWLAGHGDQVVLLGPNDLPVDVVVYGDATYPGVVAHPGVSLYTHSLERYPAYQDTNNCAVDFRDRYPPTPGKVP